MKIALISAFLFDDSVGGVENHIRFMTRELSALGHELCIFKPVWYHEEARERATLYGCDIRYVQLGKKPVHLRTLASRGALGYATGFLDKALYSLRAERLTGAVLAWQPDIVWQHDFSSSWRATRHLARTLPVVLTNHTGEYLMVRNLPGGEALLKGLLQHYRAVIGPSRELTPAFLPQSHTIHNGVDTDLFRPLAEAGRARLKRELWGDETLFVVFCPRRWAPTKGIVYLAEAIGLLHSRGERGLVFAFAGDEYRGFPDYVRQVDARLEGLSDVRKLGNVPVEAMVRYYQAADLVVIPSLMEAVSLAALEAMATGTPVLATDVGGMPEIIEPGRTGYLVPPRRADALANAIGDIRRDPTYPDVARNAERLVRASYGWRAIALQTERVLKAARDVQR